MRALWMTLRFQQCQVALCEAVVKRQWDERFDAVPVSFAS